ncbi:MAG TPA: hypothetical protein VK348_12815 [Planctomycetota bacterium]|nr:hypothetical protein [Planctomycetota bacterium]
MTESRAAGGFCQVAATLSPAGVAQRAAIRRHLLTLVRRRRAVHRSVQAMTVVTALLLLAVVLRGPFVAGTLPSSHQPAPAAEPPFPVAVAIVRDDPTVMSRALLEDGELLALLHGAGRDAGLLRTGGRALVTAAVVDDWHSSAP